MSGLRSLESVLEGRYNWGKYAYDAGLEPVPALPVNSPLIYLAKQQLAELEDMSKPATANEFCFVMYRLQGHYWQASMSEKLAKVVADDYIRLLGHYPVSVLNQAVDAWLLNPDKKFMPKIGELEEVIKSKLFQQNYKITKLKSLIESSVGDNRLN